MPKGDGELGQGKDGQFSIEVVGVGVGGLEEGVEPGADTGSIDDDGLHLPDVARQIDDLGMEHWVLNPGPGHAVADALELPISSANLTECALTVNKEMGLLERGGAAPARAARHFARLIEAGVLIEWIPHERA